MPPQLTQPEVLERRMKDIPPEPGCYLMRDGEDRILYVGKSKSCLLYTSPSPRDPT